MERELQKTNMQEKADKKGKNGQKKDSSLSVIMFSSLAAMLCVIVELYLMICVPGLLPAIAVAGLAILGFTYLSLATLVKRVAAKEAEQEEQYASILKSEKASYLLIRKYFDEISEQLSLMEDKNAELFHEIIAAQKATAKVTISRNKEHTDALMNSNDKLLDLVFQMEGKLDELSTAVSSGAVSQAESRNADLLQRQIDMTNQLSGQLREMELGLKNEILQAVNKMAIPSSQVVMAAPQPQVTMPDPFADMPDLANLDEEPEPLPDMPDLPDLDEEPEPLPDMLNFADLDEEPEPLPDMSDLPDLAEEDSEPVADTEFEPEFSEEPEEITESDEIAEPEAELIPELEPVAEELIEPEPEPVVEELPPEPEPIAEEAAPMPDLSDPNKMMSPADIAALLANIGGETSSEPEVVADEIAEDIPDEPVGEPEILDTEIVSGPEEEPVEEAPPMPDLSDPNKTMSPDEIAALFANLG